MRRSISILVSAIISQSLIAETVSGKVKHQDDHVVAGATVKVRGLDIKTRANENGEYQLNLPPGEYILDIEAGLQGHFHQAIVIADGETLNVDLIVDQRRDRTIVVSANPLEHTKLDMASPAIVLAGEELLLKRATTLGDILEDQPGVSMSSFGPAVARPVVRGLSSGRVLITNNQMTVQDASTTSADHDVSVEPLLAEQIELIKGPASLLYGSGAIGGVINVTDNRINPNTAADITGGFEARLGDSATGEQSFVGVLNGSVGDFNWHLNTYRNETDDLKIPAEAESERLLESEGEEHAEESGSFTLENSASENSGGSFGVTWQGTWGYLGVASQHKNKLYGVPGHGHHGEEHHEEEHMGEEEHHEEHAEEEGIAIDMFQDRWDIQGALYQPIDGVDEWFFGVSGTNYEHVELEGDEIGTKFDNQAYELRSYIKHENINGWDGIVGVQWQEREFSALGEEAFVPPSVTESHALFLIEEKRFGDFKLEWGARLEQQKLTVDSLYNDTESATSLSFGGVYDLNQDDKLAFNLTQAKRFPTVEERFSFGEHAATQTFERGNPNLSIEVANNLDLSYRFSTESMRGEVNLYWNHFADYIYGAYQENNGIAYDFLGQMQMIEEDLPFIQYEQANADIRGVEMQLEKDLITDENYDLRLSLMADFIEAELTSGDYIPRIPPLKYGAGLKWDMDQWSADFQWVHHDSQTHTGTNELPTDAFNMVNFHITHRISEPSYDAVLFLRAKNLLDEEARDHASFLKDLAPRAGRSFVAGVRVNF